jgi:hypothetical protein
MLDDECVRLTDQENYDAAIEAGEAALEKCVPGSEEQGLVLLALARAHYHRAMDYREEEDAEAAVPLALEAHEILNTLDSAKTASSALQRVDRAAEALPILQPLIDAIEREGQRDIPACQALDSFGAVCWSVGDAARAIELRYRCREMQKKLIEEAPNPTAAVHRRYNLAAIDTALLYMLVHSERAAEGAPILEEILTTLEQYHEHGFAVSQGMTQRLRENLEAGFGDGPATILWRMRIDQLTGAPGRRALWNALHAEMDMLTVLEGIDPRECARRLRMALAGQEASWPRSPEFIEHLLRRVRLRMREEGNHTIVTLPMTLDLVMAGERTLGDALQLCADGDELTGQL